jgi:tetratricopeptide (TPR) repeat protein
VDVAPTVLTQLGIQVPSEMQGEPLQNLLSDKAPKPGGTPPDRAAYSETDYPHRAFGWSSLRALRSGKYLYIRAPQPELYNQDTDPGAQKNLAGASSAVASTIASQLDQFRAKTGQSIIDLAKPSADEVAKLQALGYVASSSSDEPGKTKDAGIDPKSRIEVSNFLHDAMLDVEDGRYQQAVPLLQRVLKDQPEMPIAEMQLGIAQSRLNNFHEALEPLQKAVKLVPDSGMGHYELGLALFETGDWNAAAPQFEAAVARAPRWTDAHFSLAAVYARIDRVPDAMKELDIALELNPDHYRANLLRGRILSLQQNPMEALPNLEKAVQVQPKSVEAHAFLAQAYEQLGRQRDATREQHEADRLKTANP